MSEPVKKRKKAAIVRGVRPSGYLERLRRAELAKGAPAEVPSAPVPRVETIEPPAVARLPPPAPPPAPEAPIDITAQEGPVDYDKIFRALEERRKPTESEAVATEVLVEDTEAKASLLSSMEQEGFRREFQELRPLPPGIGVTEPIFPAPEPAEPELSEFERDAYRRIERENSDALKATLRAQAHEHAIYNGSRQVDPRFESHYQKYHSHALNNIEEHYFGKLRDGSVTFAFVKEKLDEVQTQSAFKPWEVDHLYRHLSAMWVRERRITRYESRGLIDRAANLSDIYSGVDAARALRQRQRNARKSHSI